MATVSVALSIPAIYVSVDGLLGGVNIANVILRLSLFTVFFLLASKVAAAYNSPLARRMIRGPVGLAVLILCSAGIWITYFASDLHGSSPGLTLFAEQPSVRAYAWFGKLYLAYAALCTVFPTWRAASSGRPLLDRAAAMSLCAGFVLVFAASLVQMTPWEDPPQLLGILSFASILLVTAGLAMVWISFIRRPTAL
ncbi:hypothetical protein [Arthrobacter sp. GMC3]|uniref:hypothetical protein n=1 Tax=Arthrobacter sp. GMC3 TaxID=2058894 RepID=UPI000CE379F6|nr:hypothetical protein [Arthrobacter sp. GMC3]